MVLSFTGVGKKAPWVGKDLRAELKSSSPLFAAAKQRWSSECARKNSERITLCVKMLFSILNECFLKHFPVVWSITMVSMCVRVCERETEQGDGTGLLLRHVDELPVRYRCHVLSQLARNALTE